MSKIAFIGLGNMGSGMCMNLAKAGLDVHAFDLNPDAVAKVVSAGVTSHENVTAAARDADIVITMLPAGAHVRSVYLGEAGIAECVSENALFIDCSTISVDDARSISADLSVKNLNMVDAPVSGGTAAANVGSLTFMVGGEDKNFARAKVYLEAMGKNIFHAGGIGNGQVAKLANNMLLGISMIATSEAFKLAEKLGLDAQTFFDISSKASGQNWSMTSYCPAPGPVPAAPSNNEYKPGFAVDMMLKDLRLAQNAANSVGAKVTFGKMAEETYARLSENGLGGLDFSSVIEQLN
ncbi:3-hydroxyisobutyrate dehydrogenase [Hirschia baltica]|uniref:3-hydroxyisobutyrate dehydrogenase n=1 Tax=Hirschia baltica (strain ATCC 49814 / DSM 5838 / IFAM 1418) TaxID=582402 RepID=C6XPV9_HIRBI|nr:3-hydroxyisobutyrate dehydrogenase [Hirschia baltica]ACT60374.1 3-hydroxyisobutyrate dehydrogenase [Hirschia baltica ATCC 49814]